MREKFYYPEMLFDNSAFTHLTSNTPAHKHTHARERSLCERASCHTVERCGAEIRPDTKFIPSPLPLTFIIILDSSIHQRKMDPKIILLLLSIVAMSQGLQCKIGE